MTEPRKSPITDKYLQRGGVFITVALLAEFCKWMERQYHKRGLELAFAREEIKKGSQEIQQLKAVPPGIKGVVENEIIENVRKRIKEDYILRSEVDTFYVLKQSPISPSEKIYWEYMQDLAFESLKKPEFRQPVKSLGERLKELGVLKSLQQMEAV